MLLATLDEATGLTVNKWGFAKHNTDGSFIKQSDEMLDVDGNTIYLTEDADGKSVFCDKYGACFVRGTLVATAMGLLPIEVITTGDQVWAYDEFRQTAELRMVTATFEKQAHQIVSIYAGGEVIEATPEHPFYVQNKWVRAGDLYTGAHLQLLNTDQQLPEEASSVSTIHPLPRQYYARSSLIVDSVAIREVEEKVYNFTVEGLHSYYVGSSSVLVHNSCLPENLKAIYDDLGETIKENYLSKMDEDQLKAFLGDIGGDNSTLTTKFFKDNPDLVDAWKVLSDGGVDDLIKRNPEALEIIDKYRNTVDSDLGKLTDKFKNAANKEDALSDVITEVRRKRQGNHQEHPKGMVLLSRGSGCGEQKEI